MKIAFKNQQLPISVNLATNRWDYFKNLANIVCSRESTYRTALDITGFDIPAIFADMFRGVKRTIETLFETGIGAVTIFFSPQIASFTGKILSRFILPSHMQADALQYLKFSMPELRDFDDFSNAVKRIEGEEVEDKIFIAELYEKAGKMLEANFYKEEANKIKDFCREFIPTIEKMKLAYKLKKSTIIGQSFLEGLWWGGSGLFLRALRKHVLGADRFTGTMNYTSEAESQELGEDSELSTLQKIFGIIAMFLAPTINFFLLNKLEDSNAVKSSRFLKIASNQLDTTHGVFPKLGLLFSVTIIPKYFGVLTTAQGWSERIERIIRLFSVVPSWWLGHRATNGLFALSADKELAKKYDTCGGILVEPEYLTESSEDSILARIEKTFPEPAKIHHVIKATKHDKSLQAEAEELHAKSLYKGFAVHSMLVRIIMMLVNYSTKLRVNWRLGK